MRHLANRGLEADDLEREIELKQNKIEDLERQMGARDQVEEKVDVLAKRIEEEQSEAVGRNLRTIVKTVTLPVRNRTVLFGICDYLSESQDCSGLSSRHPVGSPHDPDGIIADTPLVSHRELSQNNCGHPVGSPHDPDEIIADTPSPP
jgi:hypothetical protein